MARKDNYDYLGALFAGKKNCTFDFNGITSLASTIMHESCADIRLSSLVSSVSTSSRLHEYHPSEQDQAMIGRMIIFKGAWGTFKMGRQENYLYAFRLDRRDGAVVLASANWQIY
jgi:hypothetical protein